MRPDQGQGSHRKLGGNQARMNKQYSGQTWRAAARPETGRACHAIELAPAYVDVAVTRWQNFTGQTATLESTGEAFEAKSVSAIGIPPSE